MSKRQMSNAWLERVQGDGSFQQVSYWCRGAHFMAGSRRPNQTNESARAARVALLKLDESEPG